MKNIKTILCAGIVAIMLLLYACSTAKEKNDNGTVTNTTAAIKIDTLKHFHDVVREDAVKDQVARQIISSRKGKPKPPTDTTPPPPPPGPQPGCLLIDLDGHLVSGTMWNVNGDFVCGPSGFTPEQDQHIIDFVTQKYAMFPSITVTTSEAVYNSFPVNKRMRCIITSTILPGYEGSGGASYINSFNWFEDAPCFVFSALLSASDCAHAAAHECGHTFGNRHQSDCITNPDGTCTKLGEYRWGPYIMGASYGYGSLANWTIGWNSVCINQNDTLIINNSLKQ